MNPPTLRPRGGSRLQVSRLCLGGNVFGWTADEATSFSLLATKVGKDMGNGKAGLAPAYLRSAVEASLKRLQRPLDADAVRLLNEASAA